MESAPGTSFDHGVFEIVVETTGGGATDIRGPIDQTPRAEGVSATKLAVCYGCFRHVFERTITCPFCAEDVASARAGYAGAVSEARDAAAKLTSLLSAH